MPSWGCFRHSSRTASSASRRATRSLTCAMASDLVSMGNMAMDALEVHGAEHQELRRRHAPTSAQSAQTHSLIGSSIRASRMALGQVASRSSAAPFASCSATPIIHIMSFSRGGRGLSAAPPSSPTACTRGSPGAIGGGSRHGMRQEAPVCTRSTGEGRNDPAATPHIPQPQGSLASGLGPRSRHVPALVGHQQRTLSRSGHRARAGCAGGPP